MDLFAYSLDYISFLCDHENVTRSAILFWFVEDTEIREEVRKLATRNGATMSEVGLL